MRAVMLEVPQALLDERRAKGLATRTFELFALGYGTMQPVAVGPDVVVTVHSLGVRLSTVEGDDGPRLRLSWDGGQAEI